ncbi:MAG: permease-like cell division protein FtsX [Cyclobacteriaceae bacterium]
MTQKNRTKRKLGSYPFLSVTFSITLALFVVGLFGVMALHAKKLTNLIQENIEIQVYLNKQITSGDISKITRTIGSKEYVLKNEEDAKVKLITKSEAAEQFKKDTGEGFIQFLGDNPLRDVLVVNISPEYQSTDSLAMIKTEIQQLRGVYEIAYVESLVQSINENLTKIGFILLGFFVILLVVVIILINNTIKLALFSQRFLIRSMQLVGATSGFIRGPFLKRSVFYGLLSGIFASGLLIGLMSFLYKQIEDIRALQDLEKLGILFGALIVLGIVVGYLSTYRAVKKYLKMSLDDLY